ncbi:MAG TPA: response regulator transcription factor [Polyangiaceae bacterium]|nr:response regulator transcription factor [Polyangiaceae bacterium]
MNPNSIQNVLVADDHEVTRRGVKDILQETFSGVQVAEAANADAVLGLLGERPWNLLLLDVMMPGSNVLDLLKQIRRIDPKVPILMLTAATEVEYVLQTMQAGANGLIHKHRATEELIEAIHRVADGGTYLHPETAGAVAASLRPAPSRPVHTKLSERELEIFRLIALGRAIKEIAAELGLSDKTIATYVARIREKTGLTSYVEIARYALQHRLVD